MTTMNATNTAPQSSTPAPSLNLVELRRIVGELIHAGQTEKAVIMLFDLLTVLMDKNNHQAIRIAALLKDKFGRKSEKLDPAQLDLFLASLSQEAKETAEETPEDKKLEADLKALKKLRRARQPKQRRPGRNPLPDQLPREVIRIMPGEAEQTCSECGAAKQEIGEETSEVLDFVPAHFQIKEYHRVKMACRACAGEVVVAPVADKPIEGGLPGCGLLAHVVISKYKDHIPLNHLSEIYARMGHRINASTLGNWVEKVTTWLEPLYKEICKLTLDSHVVGVDDTGLKVLDRTHANNIKRGHLWAYVGYDEGEAKRVAFDYTPNWAGEPPRDFMSDRKGLVQGDAYAGLEPLFAGPNAPCTKVGCMMHARRYFKEALEAGDLRTAAPLKLFARVYRVEELATMVNASVEERLELRKKHSTVLMARLGNWLKQNRGGVEPKSLLGKAWTYSTHQWTSLQVFLTDGRVKIDNGEVERQIRPLAQGRKMYLFAGSDEGGKRAAVAYTMMGCCGLARVEPLSWLTEVLERLVGGWPARRLKELLPENWGSERKTNIVVSANAPPAEPEGPLVSTPTEVDSAAGPPGHAPPVSAPN